MAEKEKWIVCARSLFDSEGTAHRTPQNPWKDRKCKKTFLAGTEIWSVHNQTGEKAKWEGPEHKASRQWSLRQSSPKPSRRSFKILQAEKMPEAPQQPQEQKNYVFESSLAKTNLLWTRLVIAEYESYCLWPITGSIIDEQQKFSLSHGFSSCHQRYGTAMPPHFIKAGFEIYAAVYLLSLIHIWRCRRRG